jgi:uncharacterized phiE125 gp8 family phage protein
MIQYSIVTDQPDFEPVSLGDAKTHLEYVGTSKNGYITSLIKAARRMCEAYAGLSFITQTRRVKLDNFPCSKLYIELPYGPVQSVESFTYAKDDGTTGTLTEGTDFILDIHSRVARVYPINADGEVDTWPSDVRNIPHPVTIDYNAGYDDISGEALPEQIKQAILMQVASMFENRQDEQQGGNSMVNWNSMAMLDTIKVTWNANYD